MNYTQFEKKTQGTQEDLELLIFHAQLLAMNAAFEAARAGETGIELAMDAVTLRRLAQCALNRAEATKHGAGEAIDMENLPLQRKKI